MDLITEIPDMASRPMCDAEHVADAKPCPFCGKDILNRPAGPFNVAMAGGVEVQQPAMHYSEGCFLHALSISQMEVYLGWTERWNQRSTPHSMEADWMSWMQHNGMGCPVPWHTIVETIDPTGEKHTGRADDEMNVCEYGSSWVWEDETPAGYEISAYRIVAAKPVEKELAHSLEKDNG